MLSILLETYWWPTLRLDVKTFCQRCLACQLQKAVFNRDTDLRGHLSADLPRTCWSIDCAPNMPASTGGRTNIIVAVDDFSKMTLLGVLPNLTSAEVKKWMEREILYRYGKPR